MARSPLSIGQATARLQEEFPEAEITQSKVRFLEAEGLVEPERSPSGYRRYADQDMERLRYILRAQQAYLPLKVIREHLDAMDRGLEAPNVPGLRPEPRVVVAADGMPSPESYTTRPADVRISRRELVKTAEITDELLTQLEAYGLVSTRPGSPHYDTDAVVVARTAGELAAFGIEPRHLRSFRTAADREVGLVEQVVAPIRRSREAGAEGRADQTAAEIAALSVRLHATLVRIALRPFR